MKETYLYQDKHTLKSHVYKESENTQGFQMTEDSLMSRDGGNFDYLT